jgi:NUDIX domain
MPKLVSKNSLPDGEQTRLQQVAALPYRRAASGQLEFLLVTSRQRHRFIIPKGWQMRPKKDWEAAEIEARQESGVVGKIAREPIGSYRYWKSLDKHFVLIEVDVYPLRVEKSLKSWPEQQQRASRWLSPEDAVLLIDEPELATLLRNFASKKERTLLPDGRALSF